MVYVILALVVAALIGAGVCSARHAQCQRRQAEDTELKTQLDASGRAADDDVLQMGEDLQRLEADAGDARLHEMVRQDYASALAAYDDAKTAFTAVQEPEQFRDVTEILEEGRYALTCVKAHLASRPRPAKRPPCFFNPAHGPSAADVSWAPTGGCSRDVPACPADAERVAAGADPYIRTVQRDAQRVPYWEGGQAYAPWVQGYYRSWRGSELLSEALIGSFLFGGGEALFGSTSHQSADPLGAGVDVHPTPARKAGDGDARLLGQVES